MSFVLPRDPNSADFSPFPLEQFIEFQAGHERMDVLPVLNSNFTSIEASKIQVNPMYGLVNKAVEELIVSNFGEEKWEHIKSMADVDIDVFISNEGYPDELTYKLVGAAVEVLGIPAEEILVAFGEHWVLKTAAKSYGPLMKSGGVNLKEFLINLPNFHTRVAMIYPNLEPPRFQCTDVTDDGLHLHYHSHRAGLTSFVIGLIQGLGKLYDTPCATTILERKDQGADHDLFAITWKYHSAP